MAEQAKRRREGRRVQSKGMHGELASDFQRLGDCDRGLIDDIPGQVGRVLSSAD